MNGSPGISASTSPRQDTSMFKQLNGSYGYLEPSVESYKKTLILDLDETLIHTFFEPRSDADIVLKINIEGNLYKIFVLLRPGALKFIS